MAGAHPFSLRTSVLPTSLNGKAEARQRFIDLVAELRPELHRYSARMTGSVFDGEDDVQETLAKAQYALTFKDALGLSLEETAAAMSTSVPAVKAALVRGEAAAQYLTRYAEVA